MRRRQILLALAAAPAAAFAQDRKLPRIGLLWLRSPEVAHLRKALFDGLRDLGYAEGRHFVVDDATADGYGKLVEAAKGLVARGASVILTWGFTSLRAARAATERIPIILNAGIDPVATGFAASLARPGGNVTGITTLNIELQTKQASLLRETLPSARRVSALLDPTSGAQTGYFDFVEGEARKLGIRFERTDVRGAGELEPAIARAAKAKSDALYVIPSTMLQGSSRRIGELALQYRLPSFAYAAEYAEAGVLLTYGVNRAAVFRRSAGYVDRILRGASAAELPIERAAEFELVINLRTAKALGLALPPQVLLRATRQII